MDKAREFYTDFLGFSIDWEHTFDDHAPVYLQASRGGAVLHLSEHHGDASPGATARVIVDDVTGCTPSCTSATTATPSPGLEQMPWGPRGHGPRPVRQPHRLPPARRGRRRGAPGRRRRGGRPDRARVRRRVLARARVRASSPWRSASWWHPAYSPPGRADVVIEPGVGGACTMLLADGSAYRWGTVTAWEPGPLRDGLHPRAGPRPPEPDRRAVRRRRRGHADALQPRRLDGRATWPAGRGSASGRSCWSGSSRAGREGRHDLHDDPRRR